MDYTSNGQTKANKVDPIIDSESIKRNTQSTATNLNTNQQPNNEQLFLAASYALTRLLLFEKMPICPLLKAGLKIQGFNLTLAQIKQTFPVLKQAKPKACYSQIKPTGEEVVFQNYLDNDNNLVEYKAELTVQEMYWPINLLGQLKRIRLLYRMLKAL